MALDSEIRIGSLVTYKFCSSRNLGFNPYTKNTRDTTLNSVIDYTTNRTTLLRVIAGPINYTEYGGRQVIYWRAATPDQIFFWFPADDVSVTDY